MATWHCRMRCDTSNPTIWLGLPITRSSSRCIRLSIAWKFWRAPRGAVCTAWGVGAQTRGCNSGGHGGWNQEWREPLRAALDWLRDEVAPAYEKTASRYLKDPWAARNDYIDVILDRSPESRERFGARHFRREHAADRTGARMEAAGAAAPRHAHVYELRLVLRRDFGKLKPCK